MSAFAVDRKRRWNTAPRGRRCPFLNATCSDLQIADLIKLNCLKTRIGNRQGFTADGVARFELVFGVSAFPHADEKFSGLTSNISAYPEGVTQIRVAALIERASQSNPWLYRNQLTAPEDLPSSVVSGGSQAARLSSLYS
jgi:hypothetical protein